jgi:sugar lactone lactonase YvrE
MVLVIPAEVSGADLAITVNDVSVARIAVAATWASGLHQVDNPAFDRVGNLYVTYSGVRGQDTSVSIYRVTTEGAREPFASDIVNATSLAVGSDGDLYVSSRFEGHVLRVHPDGSRDVVASELGAACGLAFDGQGALYVGDRSGTVFRVHDGVTSQFATLLPSVVAFHLAMRDDGVLYVAAPTLATCDRVYRITPSGEVSFLPHRFGRPQGLAFDLHGALHVVDALAGASGVYRVLDDAAPELVVAGTDLIGLAFGADGALAVTSSDTAYRFPPA